MNERRRTPVERVDYWPRQRRLSRNLPSVCRHTFPVPAGEFEKNSRTVYTTSRESTKRAGTFYHRPTNIFLRTSLPTPAVHSLFLTLFVFLFAVEWFDRIARNYGFHVEFRLVTTAVTFFLKRANCALCTENVITVRSKENARNVLLLRLP